MTQGCAHIENVIRSALRYQLWQENSTYDECGIVVLLTIADARATIGHDMDVTNIAYRLYEGLSVPSPANVKYL